MLIEGDSELASLLTVLLQAVRFYVDHAGTAADAEALLRSRDCVAAIFDLGLPDGSGLEVLRRVRGDRHTGRRALPVLVLTARGAVSERVQGLDLGADDYMTRPFAFEELKDA